LIRCDLHDTQIMAPFEFHTLKCTTYLEELEV